MNRPTAVPRWSAVLRRLHAPQTHALRHAQVAFDSLGRLYRNRVASLMTAAVIGIALALPAGLYVLLDNLDRLSGSWNGQASLSVFLKDSVTVNHARQLAEAVRSWPEIDSVTLITPDEALEEFSRYSGFADALGTLEENPLPAVLLATPGAAHADPLSAGLLRERFRALEETEQAQLDLQWVHRLAAMLDIARRGVLLIGALLALAVLLVVGNTIRLEIQSRRDEIVVMKLIGAADGFVRRPFLYGGLWYGVFGALIAWLLVVAGFQVLAGPVQHLAGLYQSGFSLQAQPPALLLALLAIGGLLGLLGSWLAVGRHLSAIEPT
jgi:cell division transport system permease protein